MTSLYQSVGAVDAIEWACILCGHHIQNYWASTANFGISLKILCRNYSDGWESCSSGHLVIGSFIMTMCLITHQVSCRLFGETSNHPGDSASLQPRFGAWWLLAIPKLKSPLKGKRFQTISEIQENMMGQLIAIGRAAWGVYFERDWGVIVLCAMFLVSCVSFSKCLYFSYLMAGYLLDRPQYKSKLIFKFQVLRTVFLL